MLLSLWPLQAWLRSADVLPIENATKSEFYTAALLNKNLHTVFSTIYVEWKGEKFSLGSQETIHNYKYRRNASTCTIYTVLQQFSKYTANSSSTLPRRLLCMCVYVWVRTFPQFCFFLLLATLYNDLIILSNKSVCCVVANTLCSSKGGVRYDKRTKAKKK